MSSGGKAGAATIDKDSEYEAALEAIGKKKKDAQVSVEFDLDAMEGFRIKKRVNYHDIALIARLADLASQPLVADTADENQELAHGTKVRATIMSHQTVQSLIISTGTSCRRLWGSRTTARRDHHQAQVGLDLREASGRAWGTRALLRRRLRRTSRAESSEVEDMGRGDRESLLDV